MRVQGVELGVGISETRPSMDASRRFLSSAVSHTVVCRVLFWC